MLKIYCDKCGAPSSYSTQKPNFCTSCGNCLNKSILQDKKNQIKAESDLDDESFDEEINSIPNISNLEIDISVSKKNKEKISDIIGTREANNTHSTFSIQGNEPIKKEDVLKSFQQEAGAIKPRIRKHNNVKQK